MKYSIKNLSPEEVDDLLSEFPDTNAFWHSVTDRQLAYQFPTRIGDHAAHAWQCMSDLALMIQTASVSLRDAVLGFHDYLMLGTEEGKLDAVSTGRHYFDYSALCMVAGSNHLASAMWHFHEEVCEPLGREYKSAGQVRHTWKTQKAENSSKKLLETLLESSSWKMISTYRDSWSHRGIPVLTGEFRYGRRTLWQDPEDHPPPTKHFMATKRADGKVMYDSGNMTPDYRVSELLKAGRLSLIKLNETAEQFLGIFDSHLHETLDWELNENGGMTVHLLRSKPKDT